jgi:predicted dinucleotide-binding enzyme
LTKINTVVVLGAGAMGAAYASRFYDMDPEASLSLLPEADFIG